MPEAPKHRLPASNGEAIDRNQTFSFSFDGKEYSAYLGDTIGSALAANGVTTLSRSFKYHRPRGLMCASGNCPNCLVQVGDEMSVRACTRAVEPGMVVVHQNAWPSLGHDIMAATQMGGPFLPVGFYYKTFIRPQAMWPLYEKFLRQAAGLGKLNPDTPPGEYVKQYLHADVVVVGAGRSGVEAATAAAGLGAKVLLLDDQPAPGGRLRYQSARNPDELQQVLDQLAKHPTVEHYADTTVLGWWEDNWLAAMQDNRLYKIRAKAVVIATGADEQPLVFDNNDLPGVMLGSAAQRLIHLYGVRPGQKAVVVTTNDNGWEVAADLLAAGISIEGVVDARSGAASKQLEAVTATGVTVYSGYTIQCAEGRGHVQQAIIAPISADGSVDESGRERLDCDLIAISVGATPANRLLHQAGAQIDYLPDAGQFVVADLPAEVFAAGRVTGLDGHGHLVGLRAASFAGFDAQAQIDQQHPTDPFSPRPLPGSTLVHVPGHGKQILCFCEDVSVKDLETAIAEGYDSVELLKRYSTISMGPCQGKMCSTNALHLCARATGRSVAETGTTTARPPTTPVSLGVLAGQNMEPVRVTAIDAWHRAQGAKMMNAGLWVRPEHYGDPTAEVQAVRERVGLIDLSTLGKLRLTGPGVPALLERLYINKWRKLGIGSVRYGVMCNDEGVILDDGVTAHVDEHEWLMTTTSSGSNAMFEWIQWWVQSGWGEGVHVANVTDDFAAFNLAGPKARKTLQKLSDAELSNEAFPYMQVRDIEIAGVACRVMRIGFTGELSYEIHCPTGYGLHLWTALLEAGAEFDIRPFGVEAQRILRLEKAHIIVGQDTDALSDPLSADMAWAVKLDKADFLGQTFVAAYLRGRGEATSGRIQNETAGRCTGGGPADRASQAK